MPKAVTSAGTTTRKHLEPHENGSPTYHRLSMQLKPLRGQFIALSSRVSRHWLSPVLLSPVFLWVSPASHTYFSFKKHDFFSYKFLILGLSVAQAPNLSPTLPLPALCSPQPLSSSVMDAVLLSSLRPPWFPVPPPELLSRPVFTLLFLPDPLSRCHPSSRVFCGLQCPQPRDVPCRAHRSRDLPLLCRGAACQHAKAGSELRALPPPVSVGCTGHSRRAGAGLLWDVPLFLLRAVSRSPVDSGV